MAQTIIFTKNFEVGATEVLKALSRACFVRLASSSLAMDELGLVPSENDAR